MCSHCLLMPGERALVQAGQRKVKRKAESLSLETVFANRLPAEYLLRLLANLPALLRNFDNLCGADGKSAVQPDIFWKTMSQLLEYIEVKVTLSPERHYVAL